MQSLLGLSSLSALDATTESRATVPQRWMHQDMGHQLFTRRQHLQTRPGVSALAVVSCWKRGHWGFCKKDVSPYAGKTDPALDAVAWKPAAELLQNQAHFAVMFPTSQGNHPGDLCLNGPCNKHHILRPFSVLSSQLAKPHGGVKQGRQFPQTSFLQSGWA